MTLLSVQGCAPAPDADADTPASHSVTFADARAAYQTYLNVSDAAAATGDEASALTVVTSAQWAQTRSQYNALASAGTPVPRYRYGTPAFYVPALSGFPQWFVVAANRTTVTGGKPGATDSTLMLFAREKKTEDWTLSGTAVLSRPLPAIARDADGYAVPVSTTDSSLLLRPDVVGATQAAVVDDGPSSPAAAVIAAGPLTTGLHAAQAARAAAEQRRGLQYQWLLQGAPYPQVGLRLAGSGSALIMYGMYLNTSNEHPNLVAGSPIRCRPSSNRCWPSPPRSATTRCSPTGRTSSPRSTRPPPRATASWRSSGRSAAPASATPTRAPKSVRGRAYVCPLSYPDLRG